MSVKLIRELVIGSDASEVERAYATGWNNYRTASRAALQDLADLIKQAQSHMVRTPEADKISVALSQYINDDLPTKDGEIDRSVDLYDAFAIGRRIHLGESKYTQKQIDDMKQHYAAEDNQLLENFVAGLNGDKNPIH